MIHLGDITKIDGRTAPVVDCIIGGSPCQDLSVAGRQAGLAGKQSGLFMEQIRIVKEMREEDRRRGRTGNAIRPRYMVWENVPGAFSSNKREDFKAVLEEIIRIAEPEAPDIPLPPKGKWPLADAYYGDGWSVAYRVLDAQFWGVPQRRRRIALVADFGGQTAPEILFERESVSGDIAPSGSAREEIAADLRAGAVDASGGGTNPVIRPMDQGGTDYLTGWDCQEKRIFTPNGVAPTLSGSDGGGGRTGCGYILVPSAFRIGAYYSKGMMSDNPKAGIIQVDKACTLDCNGGAPTSQQGGVCIVQPSVIACMATQQGGAEVRCDDKSPTLTATAGMSGNNQPVVCMASVRDKAEILIDKAPSLLAGHEHPIILTFPDEVANALLAKSQLSFRADQDNLVLQIGGFSYKAGGKAKGIGHEEERSPTLSAERHDASVVIAKVYDARGNGDGEIVPTLTGDHENRVTDYTAIAIAVDCRNGTIDPETNGTLQAKPGGGTSLNLNNVVLVAVPSEATSFDLAEVTSKTNQSKGSVGVAYSLAKTGQPAVITTTEDGTILVDGQPCVLVKLLVRRLTPLECERLQGYPDGWTVLPPIEDMSEYEYDFWRRFHLEKAEREGKARANEAGDYTVWRKVETKNADGETVETWEDTGKPYKHKTREQMVAWYNKSFASDTDGPRYMALGNSIALPPWKWVLKRIAAHYERDATMASLFDGIGGFPLLWEQLNGKETCLWASEIEAFPVAVTRHHFEEATAR